MHLTCHVNQQNVAANIRVQKRRRKHRAPQLTSRSLRLSGRKVLNVGTVGVRACSGVHDAVGAYMQSQILQIEGFDQTVTEIRKMHSFDKLYDCVVSCSFLHFSLFGKLCAMKTSHSSIYLIHRLVSSIMRTPFSTRITLLRLFISRSLPLSPRCSFALFFSTLVRHPSFSLMAELSGFIVDQTSLLKKPDHGSFFASHCC